MDKLLKNINGDLYYYGYNLKELAKKYKTPLKITFLDIIRDRVVSLKEAFNKAILDTNYKSKFIYLNANKANYGKEEIETSFIYADGLETSSYYDILLSTKMFMNHPECMNKYMVCNGYKEKDSLDEIIKLSSEGYHIIDIIDSMDEYEYLKERNVNVEVGLRIHLKALYAEEGEVVQNDRFGLMKREVEYILKDIVNTKLKLTTIHFHQRGFDYEKDKFYINFDKAFKTYIDAAQRIKTITNFDMGGGTPLPVSDNFDYYSWAKELLSHIKDLCNSNGIIEPNIISENGKYSQKDSTINLYKVIAKKYTDEIPWFVVNGSLLIALPEMYALGEPILVTPVNDLNNDMIKARLAGVTCDCDDIYYLKDKGYISLPDSNELYIGCIGTGSYQNSMNGKGGVHHCLLPEEKDLIIKDRNVYLRHDLQSIDDIYRIINLK